MGRIVTLHNNVTVASMLEPQLIANLSGEPREAAAGPSGYPKAMVNAALRRGQAFLLTGALTVARAQALCVNARSDRRSRRFAHYATGAHLGLEPDKNWKRKVTEALITLTLEAKLTKKQIFEHYCNGIYLGQHETFSIHGFGQAARVYFNKDLEQVTLPEAALLAGIVQRPSYFVPHRHPARALARRNLILGLMQSNGFITQAERDEAAKTPLGLKAGSADWGESPISWRSPAGTKRASATRCPTMPPTASHHARHGTAAGALESVAKGMEEVDKIMRGDTARRSSTDGAGAAALVALDPRTGEIKAAVGGRNYASSQLNHLLGVSPVQFSSRSSMRPRSAFA